VCGPNGCPSSAVASGIRYAADNGANVINLSLGGRFGSTTEQQALQYALGKNVLPLCATGNDGSRTNISYPAKFPECVAVGATDWGDARASYSNAGNEIDLSAPGGDSEDANGYSYILSTYNDGTYVFMSGTSMATPQVAGLAGLLHAIGVTGASNIRSRLENTADDLGTAGWDKYFGRGRINAYRAINNLR
jgi:serine protease